MSAIITENFRRNNAVKFLEDLAASNYYIGLGRSNPWPINGGFNEDDNSFSVVDPIGTTGDDQEVKNNLTTLIGVQSATYSQVIPNIAAKVNHCHKAYNPYDPDCFYQTNISGTERYPCYAVVGSNVYLCLREPTVVSPSGTYDIPAGVSRNPIVESDGSVWIYVYTVQPGDPINTTQFITCPTDHTLNGGEVEADITTGSGNLVYGFTVMDSGSGYSAAPTIEYVTSGSAIALTVTMAGIVPNQTVSKVTWPLATVPSTWSQTRGYVRVASGNARVFPNIASPEGIGFYPAKDLPSWYTGVATETVNDELTYTPYRQISIVKEPEYEVGTTTPTVSLNCLQYLNFGVGTGPSAALTGYTVTQAATGAIGIVDYYDDDKLFYHQTYTTGFIPFDDTDVVVTELGVGTFNPTTVSTSEYVKGTGDVVFSENRKKITRASGQTEEITIILQF